MKSSEVVIAGLLILGVGYIVYQVGRNKGNNEGYERAQIQHGQLVRKVTANSIALQVEKARLLQENGIVKNLLHQQPTTPEAEAILKAVGRVELQLTHFLPPAFEDGEDHDTAIN